MMKKAAVVAHSDLMLAMEQFKEKAAKWDGVRNGSLLPIQGIEDDIALVIRQRRTMVTSTLVKESASKIVEDFAKYSSHQIDDDVALRLAFGNLAIRIVKHYYSLMSDYDLWVSDGKKQNLPDMLVVKALAEANIKINQLEKEVLVLKQLIQVYSDAGKRLRVV